MPIVALAAAGIGSSIIGAFGANSAANKQVDAANNAANLEFQASNNALNFQKQQYQNSLQMLNPYLQTGYGALGLLRTGLGIPGDMPQGFSLPSSTTPALTLNNLGNLSQLRQQLQLGSNGGPQPFQATSAAVPNGGFGFNGGPSLLNDGTTSGGVAGARANPAAVPNGNGGTFSTNQGGGAVQNFAPGTGPAAGNGQTPGGGNVGFGSLLESFPGGPFTAPTGVTEQNDPGYQFRLNQGINALQNSAAARGGLLSGGTAKSLEDFAQNDASNEYQNVYNRALNTYGTNYNQFVNDQTNQFNKLAAISGLGQTSAQDLSTAGLNTANSITGNLLGTAGAVGQDLQNAGDARASGIINTTNAINGGIGNLSQLEILKQMGLIG